MANSWYPGATKKEISKHVRSREGSKGDAFVLHIAVSNSSSLYSYFSGAGVCSHFYVTKSGHVEQYLPISSKSSSEKNGNHHTISCETQGGTSSDAKKPWTKEQVTAMAKIAKWLHDEWGMPLRQMQNSNASEKGVGYHRLGIDGNFPSSGIYAGRKQRGTGELWSDSSGKTCPENYSHPPASESRIIQVADVIAEAGGSTPDTSPSPPGKLVIDGKWGNDTTYAAQRELGTSADGEVWNQNSQWKSQNPGLTNGWKWTTDPNKLAKGSPLIEALQKHLNAKGGAGLDPDGLIGPATIKALQKRLAAVGYYEGDIDGKIDLPSLTVEGLQRALNELFDD